MSGLFVKSNTVLHNKFRHLKNLHKGQLQRCHEMHPLFTLLTGNSHLITVRIVS